MQPLVPLKIACVGCSFEWFLEASEATEEHSSKLLQEQKPYATWVGCRGLSTVREHYLKVSNAQQILRAAGLWEQLNGAIQTF